MLNTILSKKERLSGLLLALSVSLASKYVRKGRGGKVRLARGMQLVILPQAILTDRKGIVISTGAVQRRKYICLDLGPDGTTFAKDKPAELRATWKAISRYNIDGLTLYGEDGKEIEGYETELGAVWYIPHFSLYYFRRR